MSRRPRSPHAALAPDLAQSPTSAIELAELRAELDAHQKMSDMRWAHYFERYEADRRADREWRERIDAAMKPLMRIEQRGRTLVWFFGLLFAVMAAAAAFVEKIFAFFVR